jgi:hypothetical protein
MLCFKKMELMMEYNEAVAAYSGTVSVWVAKANAGKGSKELQSLHAEVEKARYAVEDARHEFESHIAHHGCKG